MDTAEWVSLGATVAMWVIGLSVPALVAVLIRLTVTGERLNSTVSEIVKDIGGHGVRLDKHEERLGRHDVLHARHEQRLDHHERRLDGEK